MVNVTKAAVSAITAATWLLLTNIEYRPGSQQCQRGLPLCHRRHCCRHRFRFTILRFSGIPCTGAANRRAAVSSSTVAAATMSNLPANDASVNDNDRTLFRRSTDCFSMAFVRFSEIRKSMAELFYGVNLCKFVSPSFPSWVDRSIPNLEASEDPRRSQHLF